MKKYELALVLIANLSEEDKLAELGKIKETITRFGGQITNVDDWGKRKLAYEIKKVQKHKEGFYYFIHFNAETSVPAELESRLRIMEKVLRYLIINLEDK
ncbi:MAG: 30S ribosomal protein S6 [Candidatus Epulonipiscium fishelsonii]|nr:MAG: 30S ribosomal protein S6 [Epulopiscium sp. AS2M-Bin002]